MARLLQPLALASVHCGVQHGEAVLDKFVSWRFTKLAGAIRSASLLFRGDRML